MRPRCRRRGRADHAAFIGDRGGREGGVSEQRQLLIVEDDDAFARTLRRSFERRDYAVRVAASPEEVEALLGD